MQWNHTVAYVHCAILKSNFQSIDLSLTARHFSFFCQVYLTEMGFIWFLVSENVCLALKISMLFRSRDIRKYMIHGGHFEKWPPWNFPPPGFLKNFDVIEDIFLGIKQLTDFLLQLVGGWPLFFTKCLDYTWYISDCIFIHIYNSNRVSFINVLCF